MAIFRNCDILVLDAEQSTMYLGQMLVGFNLGWSAPVLLKLQDKEQTPLPEVITDEQSSWVASVILIGGIIGLQISGFLSNNIGRKPCLIIGGLISSASFILLANAYNLAMVFAGRIIVGVGLGMIIITNLVYLGEIGSANIRGALLTAINVVLTFGLVIAFSAGPFVSYSAICYIGLGLSAIYLAGLFLIPESPIFYVLKGKTDEARQALTLLGRTDENDVFKILSTEEEKKPTVADGCRDLIGMKSNRKAFSITFTLCILQQMSGVVVVTFFVTTIFKMAGSTIRADIATITIGLTQLTASCICPLIVERTGRRVLLSWSSALCSLSLVALGLYFFFDDAGYNMEAVGWLPLVCLIGFFIVYDLGFGGIPGALLGELYGNTARSIGSSVTFTAAWLCSFTLSSVFAYMIDGIGAAFTFWVFALACALAFIFTLFFVPETKGKTLFEIQEMLNR